MYCSVYGYVLVLASENIQFSGRDTAKYQTEAKHKEILPAVQSCGGA